MFLINCILISATFRSIYLTFFFLNFLISVVAFLISFYTKSQLLYLWNSSFRPYFLIDLLSAIHSHSSLIDPSLPPSLPNFHLP